MNGTDPLLILSNFISYCYHKRVHDNKEFNPGTSKPYSKSWPTKSLWTAIFIWVHFQQKQIAKFFKIKKKTLFWGHFCVKGIFPKNSGYVQLQGSPSIQMSKIRSRLVIKPKFIPSLSTCKNCSINLLNSSNRLWDTPDLRVLWSIRSHSFLTMLTQ